MKLIEKDSILWGVIFCLAGEVLCALLLWLVLWIGGLGVEEHVRWFAVAFVPPVLLLRYYAHSKAYPTTLKAVIVTFFVTFVAFMWFLLKYRYINFN
jgi:hypothetical protein